jgi:hypothetical protein
MDEAMIAANDASICCMARKFNPRYSPFWHRPNTTTERAVSPFSRQLCPKARAISTAIAPEMAKRADSVKKGGAPAINIRAVAKADDHMIAKTTPMPIAKRSIAPPKKIKRAATATLLQGNIPIA